MNSEFNSLELGCLPDKFNFGIQINEKIDLDKLQFNALYKSPLFYLNKMPNPTAFLRLPASMELLEQIANNSLTPLEELSNKRLILECEIKTEC